MKQTMKSRVFWGLICIWVSLLNLSSGRLFCGVYTNHIISLGKEDTGVFNIGLRLIELFASLDIEKIYGEYAIFKGISVNLSILAYIIFIVFGFMLMIRGLKRETVATILIADIIGLGSILMEIVYCVFTTVEYGEEKVKYYLYDNIVYDIFSFQTFTLILILISLFYYSRTRKNNIKLVREGGTEIIQSLFEAYRNNELTSNEYSAKKKEIINQIEAAKINLNKDSIVDETNVAYDDELPDL